ncbi:MAG: PEP-utilizing enzyme, partial [Ilumatobacter sp.]|uniref:PEP-utilizing enzyme n=1 Tax=Ilumatobacter sp. TaxID=1967498 RepID=UPI003C70FEED
MSSRRWQRIWSRTRRPERAPGPHGTIAIGSGDATAQGVAPKAALLDEAAAAGLDVPFGFIVPDGVDATTLTGRWFRSSLAVRSAFGAEDGSDSSLAGWFTSRLGVSGTDFTEAVAEVRESANRHDGTFRLDVLVMAMVDAHHAGVAFSEPGTYDDVANVTEGLADRLVSGEVEGERVLLPRLEPAPDGWPARLRALLHETRAVFGDEPWDIEWADDGATCWLVQIRPITTSTTRDETLTAANHAEILPRLPSHLMTSIVEEAGSDLFAWYRRRIPGLPAERDFLHVVVGRPMINLSLLEDMMRHLGLPTKLVAASIGGGHSLDQPLAPVRVARHSPSLVRLGLAQISAVIRSTSIREKAAAIGTAAPSSFTEAIDDLHRSYVALVTGMFPLSSAIGPPLAALRSAGTLLEHASRHRTITAELASRRAELRRTSGERRDEVLHRFLADFGHRGVYESDIARPRYRDDPATLADERPTTHLVDVPAASSATRRSWKGRLTLPIWWLAAKPMTARELLRHDAMRSFAEIRSGLVARAGRAVEIGQLATVDDLWMLSADEVRRLDDGWSPDAEFWNERQALRTELDALDVPHVVRRFDDPADWNADGASEEDGVWRGLSLTTGRVSGRAWVLDEPADRPPEGWDPASTILIARSIDAGWISTIADVAAVVVEIGGDLSHGSILVRELGIPAVT